MIKYFIELTRIKEIQSNTPISYYKDGFSYLSHHKKIVKLAVEDFMAECEEVTNDKILNYVLSNVNFTGNVVEAKMEDLKNGLIVAQVDGKELLLWETEQVKLESYKNYLLKI